MTEMKKMNDFVVKFGADISLMDGVRNIIRVLPMLVALYLPAFGC